MANFFKLQGGTIINLDHVSRVDPPDEDDEVRVVGPDVDEYLKPGDAGRLLAAIGADDPGSPDDLTIHELARLRASALAARGDVVDVLPSSVVRAVDEIARRRAS